MRKVLLALPQGFEMLEAAAFTDVFGWNMLLGDKKNDIICCGPEQTVTASFGGDLCPGLLFSDINCDDFSALALPGGFSRFGYFRSAYTEPLLSIVKDFSENQKPIAAVCTGSLVLGKAGILKNRNATTYAIEQGYYQKELANYGAIVKNNPIVIDTNIITGQSPAAAIPVALTLLSQLSDYTNALHIAKNMGYPSEIIRQG